MASKIPGWQDGEFGHKLGELITYIVENIKQTIEDDKERRSQFTKDVIHYLNKENSHFNYVICHSAHETHFDGEKFEDWGHRHQEIDGVFWTTVGFEIYWFRSGVFKRKGDGGFLNWSYIGNVVSTSGDGKVLHFNERG